MKRTYAVRRPLVVVFEMDSGLTVALNDDMFRTWPNIPWLSRDCQHKHEQNNQQIYSHP